MTRAIVLLLQQNKWTNIAAVIDSNSVLYEPLHLALIEAFDGVFSFNESSLGIRYQKFQCNATGDIGQMMNTLVSVSAASRSKNRLFEENLEDKP